MTAPITPWYRQAWPWFLISLPATAVIAGSNTFYLEAKGWDGPVAKDYYKQGLAINEELTRSLRARELGVAATVKLGGLNVGERVRVELQSAQPLPAEAALRVIKGRMTLREVSDQCAVPLDQLLAALNLPPDTDPALAIKDLISQGKLSEVTVVKDAVAKLQK